MNNFYIGDFETEKFDENKDSNYVIVPFFIHFQKFYEGEFFTFELAKYDESEQLKEFLAKCCSIKNPTTLYFHNLKFDYKFLEQFLPKQYECEIKNNSGHFLEICLFKNKTKKVKGKEYIERQYVLKIRDSINLLISSLEKIGKSLKFPKIETKYYSLKEYLALSKKEFDKFHDYGKQDCRIVRKAIWELIQFVNKTFELDLTINKLPLTLPSLCKKVWLQLMERKFGENYFFKVFDKNAKEYEDFYRQYYFAGRVEVFNFNPAYNACYNDKNGFYAWAMANHKFPLPPYDFKKCDESSRCSKQFANNELIFGALCEVVENQDIPLVPYRIKEKVIYPNGTKKCFLFREEIEYLLDLGQKCRILEVAICSEWSDIFSEYELKTYFEREKLKLIKEGDSFWGIFYKYFAVQLYGKFAERSESETTKFFNLDEIELTDELKEKLEEKAEIREYGEQTLLVMRETKKKFTQINLFYAMRIVALCRLELHKCLCRAKNIGELFYCDTDSLVTEYEIEDSAELGHLKVEFRAIQFQALSAKEYCYTVKNDKGEIEIITKIKGFSKNLVCKKDCNKCADFKDNECKLNKIKKFEDFTSKYLKPKRIFRPAGFFESIRRGLKPGEILVFDKEKSSLYDKRWILEDLTTKAFNIDNENFEDLLQNNEKRILELINNANYL